MKVIKRVNNNAAVCLDNDGYEVIAFGKGIGFPQLPYELTDLSRIQRTYYGINANYLALLNEISEEIFELSANIVDYAKIKIEYEFNSNIVFTLADHINFVIERYEKGLEVKMPFSYEVKHLYEKELDIGEYAVNLIKKEMNIHPLKDEAVSIALHFINAGNMQINVEGKVNEKRIIDDLTKTIEKNFNIVINREGFNYSRFVSHLQYLLKRSENNASIESDNRKLFDSIKMEFKETYDCVLDFRQYLDSALDWHLGNEELLYLMLHINRLCAREDCNQ